MKSSFIATLRTTFDKGGKISDFTAGGRGVAGTAVFGTYSTRLLFAVCQSCFALPPLALQASCGSPATSVTK